MEVIFLSTLSLRRATPRGDSCYLDNIDFYPRSPCGERPKEREKPTQTKHFYPRSPCGERPRPPAPPGREFYISIHALLAESDISVNEIAYQRQIFLSTLSLRRATSVSSVINNIINNFYPRSPCGERLVSWMALSRRWRISIHALLAESDHAPNRRPCPRSNFYPRSPCGERPKSDSATAFPLSFLSTLSLRRATSSSRDETAKTSFLSTLSLRRATSNRKINGLMI